MIKLERIQPSGGRLLLTRVIQTQTAGGIAILTDHDKVFYEGTILAKGPGRLHRVLDQGEPIFNEIQLLVGQTVLVSSMAWGAGLIVPQEDDDLEAVILSEEALEAVLKPEALPCPR